MVKELETESAVRCNLASITFDDGYVNFAELALPILDEYDCHSTIFIPSGKVGHYNDWDEYNSDFNKMQIMSYDQLIRLKKDRLEIGSHGISHTPLNTLSHEEILKEIIYSKNELEQKLGIEVNLFSFPYGIYPVGSSPNFFRYKDVVQSTYRGACTSWWGRHNKSQNIFRLMRVGIWDSDNLETFIDKLVGAYDWIILKEKLGCFIKQYFLQNISNSIS